MRGAIDLSDGLVQDLGHLCRASGVGGCIEMQNLPLSEPLRRLAAVWECSPDDWALYGGEDYLLLVTVDQQREEKVRAGFRSRFGRELFPIGRITTGDGVVLQAVDGKVVNAGVGGYDHFRQETGQDEP